MNICVNLETQHPDHVLCLRKPFNLAPLKVYASLVIADSTCLLTHFLAARKVYKSGQSDIRA